MAKNKSVIVFGTHSSLRSVDSYCLFVGGNDVGDADNVQCFLNYRRKRLPGYLLILKLAPTSAFTVIRMEKWDLILIEAKIAAKTDQLKEIIMSLQI